MYDSAIYLDARSTLENCRGLRQLFEVLPPETELSVHFDDRIFATLTCIDKHIHLEPRKSARADIELILFPELIRRLKDNSPEDITSLAGLFAEMASVGHAQIRLLSPVKSLYKKGYVESLKGLGLELQRDLAKYSFLLMGKISQTFEAVKTLLKQKKLF